MKHASLWALGSAALVVGIAYACAVPVEVEGCAPGSTSPDCVVVVQASEFEADASVSAQGGNSGAGGVNPPSGGSSSNPPPSGGSAGTGSPPPVGGSPGQGQAGSGSSAGAGGASGGSAGAGAAGAGGSAGTTGSAGTAGTTGAAGAGGTTGQSAFSVAACDFVDRVGCEAFACATACPTGMGNYCLDNCQAILTCVAATPSCVTEQDPMCGVPFQNPYRENVCTPQVNNSGSSATANTPAFVALRLVQCLCSDPRP